MTIKLMLRAVFFPSLLSMLCYGMDVIPSTIAPPQNGDVETRMAYNSHMTHVSPNNTVQAAPSNTQSNDFLSEEEEDGEEGGYEYVLHQVVRDNNEEFVETYASAGLDMDLKDSDGKTALHVAAEIGNSGMLRLLIQLGADVNLRDELGRTALHRAAELGNIEILRLLKKELGADVTLKDNNGNSALHLAAQKGHIKIVRLLVKIFGLNVNEFNKSGQTALHLAVENGHLDMVFVLTNELRADVDPRPNLSHLIIVGILLKISTVAIRTPNQKSVN